MNKKLIIEIEFEERVEDEEYTSLNPVAIRRTHSDLTDAQIDALGETIGQSDTWQVDRWMDLQRVLGDAEIKEVKIRD